MNRREFVGLVAAAAAHSAVTGRIEIPSRQLHFDDVPDFDARRLTETRVNAIRVPAQAVGSIIGDAHAAKIKVAYTYFGADAACGRALQENREIVAKYPVDGVFVDNIGACQRALFDLVKAPNRTVFFNNRPLFSLRRELDFFTHLEFDSLDDLHYLRTLGKDCLGHTTADEFACLNLIANGAKVSIRGPLTPEVGRIFRKLETLEPWTQNCRPVADIGVLYRYMPALVELHQQFDVIDAASDFALYKLIIVPEGIPSPPNLAEKLRQYRDRDGAVLPLSANTPKQILGEMISKLLVRPSVIAPNLPSTARVTMLEQRTPGQMRRIVHLLSPAPLENIQLSVSLPQHPLNIVLIPSEKPLEFKHNEFYSTFTVPRVDGHQAIACE